MAAGLSRQMLRAGRFRCVRRGVYAEVSVRDEVATEADAALLLLPNEAVLSHATAAQLRGLPVPPCSTVHVTLPPQTGRPRMRGVRVHEAAVSAAVHDGRPLTTPEENFVELAECLTLVDLVVLGDAMVRRGLTTCLRLRAAVATTTRRRGIRLARRAAELVRADVDSPQETRVRLLVVLAGLPEPQPGFVIRDDLGEWLGAVNLAYGDYRIVIEYHGDVHRKKAGRWRSDVAKAELLRGLGWTVIILTSEDLDRPDRTLDRILRALREAGHPQLPPVPGTGWRPHLIPAWAVELAAATGDGS
jgi:hypothetical protein